MSWEMIGPADAVREGQPLFAMVGRREVAVIRYGEMLYAVLNVCPHAGAPIARGRIEAAMVNDESGRTTRDEARPVLRCPWHHWEFDLATGAALCPIKQRLKTYPLKVEEGQVWVEI